MRSLARRLTGDAVIRLSGGRSFYQYSVQLVLHWLVTERLAPESPSMNLAELAVPLINGLMLGSMVAFGVTLTFAGDSYGLGLAEPLRACSYLPVVGRVRLRVACKLCD